MYCNFEACLECCKTYILEQPIPHCMNIRTNCSREWSRKFLSDNFPQTFLTTKYKLHREDVLLEQERALFVETQPYVENQIELEKNYQEITKISAEIASLNKIYDSLVSKSRQLSNKKTQERQQYIRSCPKNGCNGFLNYQWKCGICESKYCKYCHQSLNNNGDDVVIKQDTNSLTIDDNITNEYVDEIQQDTREESKETTENNESLSRHVCKADDLATAKLLEKDTKPCPKCNMGIFKIDGCNQMFCTNCNTAFDWITRRIMNVNIHNPHYFEWIRRQGTTNTRMRQNTNPNDCPVFTEITNETSRNIVIMIRSKKNINESKKESLISDLLSICRNILHMRHVIIPHYTYDYVERNRNLRILLMRNKIQENEFKIQIQKNDKKYAKSQEIYNVLQLLVNGTSDIILRFTESLRNSSREHFKEETEMILNEIEPIVNYANECFNEISLTYKSKKIVINRFITFLHP